MNVAEVFACAFVFLLQYVFAESGESLARGFNEKIAWKNYENGVKDAKATNKPIMLLIHKTWCGACKALKPKFAASEDIYKLSQGFEMINVQDEEENSLGDGPFAPDGGYIPRILFLDPQGQVQNDVINTQGSDKYKYYYPDPSAIANSMRNMLAKFAGTGAKPTDEL